MSHPFAKETATAGGESQSLPPEGASSLTRPAPIERRFQRIYDIGCIACAQFGFKTPCQVHHLNLDEHAGQKRLGDEYTIGLCPWHHVGEPLAGMTQKMAVAMLGPSMKHEPLRFRASFGTDEQLLARQNYLIARLERLRVGSTP